MQITERTRSLYRCENFFLKVRSVFGVYSTEVELQSETGKSGIRTVLYTFQQELISANRIWRQSLPGGLPDACNIDAKVSGSFTSSSLTSSHLETVSPADFEIAYRVSTLFLSFSFSTSSHSRVLTPAERSEETGLTIIISLRRGKDCAETRIIPQWRELYRPGILCIENEITRSGITIAAWIVHIENAKPPACNYSCCESLSIWITSFSLIIRPITIFIWIFSDFNIIAYLPTKCYVHSDIFTFDLSSLYIIIIYYIQFNYILYIYIYYVEYNILYSFVLYN